MTQRSDELILRTFQGTATAGDHEALERWRLESAANQQRFEEVSRVWALLGESAVREGSPRPSARELLAAADRGPVPLLAAWKGRARTLPALARAAVVLLGLSVGAIWWSGRAATPALTMNELSTGRTEMVTTRLSDGTTVRLAPNSRLEVRSGGQTREVWLEGQAFFAVAPGSRPFAVRTRLGEAIVLGTRFDVRTHDDEIRIAVVEGRVALEASGSRVEAGAGQVGRAASGGAPVVEALEDLRPLLAWMDGFLAFQDTPLETALAEIELRFGIQARVTDPALAQRTVSVWIDSDDPVEGLMILCRAVGAQCTIQDSVATIRP
jgi:transmembrane sensor